jgi:histidinol-phosphate aminotransferase
MPQPQNIIRDEIRALAAYHVPVSQGMVKLDAMENPYGLPLELRDEVARLVAACAINRYPDPAATELKSALRAAMQIPAGMELMLGNGSDELIQIVAMATAKPGAVLLSVEPSFVMYRMIATFTGMRYAGVPLKADFTLDVDAVLQAIATHQPALIFLAYPNNPTGNLFDADDLSRIIRAAPGLVVVDEAYNAFADASFMPRLHEFSNLLVMRTLSKQGLAGLRLGVLAGSADWLAHLEKLRLPYNINVLTQAVAHAVLQHGDVLAEQAESIVAQRTVLQQQLGSMAGVEIYPSQANFILFRVADADRVFQGLKARGILIKNLNSSHPMLSGCLRVTVGTPEENEKFVHALRDDLVG